VQLLSILEQNREARWEELLGATEIEADRPHPLEVADDVDDELASFKL
jgi:hypothetical protein